MPIRMHLPDRAPEQPEKRHCPDERSGAREVYDVALVVHAEVHTEHIHAEKLAAEEYHQRGYLHGMRARPYDILHLIGHLFGASQQVAEGLCGEPPVLKGEFINIHRAGGCKGILHLVGIGAEYLREAEIIPKALGMYRIELFGSELSKLFNAHAVEHYRSGGVLHSLHEFLGAHVVVFKIVVAAVVVLIGGGDLHIPVNAHLIIVAYVVGCYRGQRRQHTKQGEHRYQCAVGVAYQPGDRLNPQSPL